MATEEHHLKVYGALRRRKRYVRRLQWLWCDCVIVTLSLCTHYAINCTSYDAEPIFIYICSVNVLCADATAMLFHSTIPLTVWRAPHCNEL